MRKTEKKRLADEAEKEEMFKKYITNPDSIKGKDIPRRDWFGKRAKIGLVAFIILAFVVGTSMGSFLIPQPSEVPQVSMMVNSSAFLPVANNTTSNVSTTTTKNTQTVTETTPTTTDTSTDTPTDTTPVTPTPTNGSG